MDSYRTAHCIHVKNALRFAQHWWFFIYCECAETLTREFITPVKRNAATSSNVSWNQWLHTARLDFCNSLMYGTCVHKFARIQIMQNSLVRLILHPHAMIAANLCCVLFNGYLCQRESIEAVNVYITSCARRSPTFLSNVVSKQTYTTIAFWW